jgi:RimJ/RimL family protein N-acetyltransferase
MIETERLILSTWTEADRPAFLKMTADPAVMWDYGGPFTPEEAARRFDRQIEAFQRDGFGKWALRRKEDGTFFGYCGVSPIFPTLAPAPGLEIGWRMMTHGWGQGFVTEAARAVLKDIFRRTDAAEVISFTMATNVRSLAVMRRIGLRRDASRDFRYETGFDAIVYVADRAAWDQAPSSLAARGAK